MVNWLPFVFVPIVLVWRFVVWNSTWATKRKGQPRCGDCPRFHFARFFLLNIQSAHLRNGYADDLLDLLFPLDQRIMPVATIYRPDCPVGLATPDSCNRLLQNHVWSFPKPSQVVHRAYPYCVGHIRRKIADKGVYVDRIQHRFNADRRLESLIICMYQWCPALSVTWRVCFPVWQYFIVLGADGETE